MAGELPSLETTRAAVWLHDWHSYEDYKTVQDRYMTQLMNEGLVEENGLVFDEVRDGRALLAVNIAGRLGCTAGPRSGGPPPHPSHRGGDHRSGG